MIAAKAAKRLVEAGKAGRVLGETRLAHAVGLAKKPQQQHRSGKSGGYPDNLYDQSP